MASSQFVERLTPFDHLMPRTYVSALFVFPTTDSLSSIRTTLQGSIRRLAKELPWITGRVHPVSPEATPDQKPALELRWHAGEDLAVPTIIDKGTIAQDYEHLKKDDMQPSAIPSDVWPVPAFTDEATAAKGLPVFASSLFSFQEGTAVGLCICMHHNTVDATGFTFVVKKWTQHLQQNGGSNPVDPVLGTGRLEHLSSALASELQSESLRDASPQTIVAAHPEYSLAPPSFPSEFPVSTSRLFTISRARLDTEKAVLASKMPNHKPPTTNALLCAAIWSAVTRARKQRNPVLEQDDVKSLLATAVNGRRRIHDDDTFSTSDRPYVGNVILYALADLPVKELCIEPEQGSTAYLKSTASIVASQSKVDRHYIAQVYSLADKIADYHHVFVGWDLFNSKDLTITSWSGLDLYELNFGPLGAAQFIRPPHSSADGVAIILPKKASSDGDVVEVLLMLREDDLETLTQDRAWKGLLQ